ncbi:MAG: hypothetical protein NVV74_03640 [Magnetospirillum sp.]|nr:hypothetical protein [Magnetospirillum sp.]
MHDPKAARSRADGPSDAATYERARRHANLAMWTIALQRRRLKTTEPEDAEFLFRRWSDFQFLIVALRRLRRAATLAAKVPVLANEMRKALARFDAAIPASKKLRDIAEHFDDYALDRGRDPTVSRRTLEVGAVGDSVFEWLGEEINADAATSGAQILFKDIQDAQYLIASEETDE